ncbi:alpha-L-fucosidase [Aquirufa sp.]|jgi:alpha-L-fucosidase|uniref:alpha-L-fucosidase n=1 Tax=Aquirufa sp. TaxID=2676249 RepID=UPI003783AD1E
MFRFTLLLTILSTSIFAQKVSPVYPIPSAKQLAWSELEYYGFIHFNMNTFTNVEWGEGKESPSSFNPSALDCNQWARIAKKAGMKGLILTVKHHDGFALYPSKYTTHSVAKSPWKNGKGDVVKDLSEACKKYGLKLGIYLSPWDRFHPDYGTDKYNQVYAKMQEELLTNYGPIFEFWYDGANGEGPNGRKQVYDWPLFHSMVNKYQPNAVQFSDAGPDIRWVGNERGYAYDTMWSPILRDKIYPGCLDFDNYRNGQENGTHWVSPEVDVSIRPGWYYHPDQDDKVKTPDSLLKIYVASVGRNANLLLNIPVDTRGLIHENDSASLMGFAAIRAKSLVNLLKGNSVDPLFDGKNSTYWMASEKNNLIKVDLNFVQKVNTIMLQEPIALGQRVSSFEVELVDETGIKEVIKSGTIGHKRMITFKERKLKSFQIRFTGSRGPVLISNLEAYRFISTRNEPLFQ